MYEFTKIIKKFLAIKKPDGRPVYFNTYEKGAQSFLCFTKIRNHRQCDFNISCIEYKKNRKKPEKK